MEIVYGLTDKGKALLASQPRHEEPTNYEHCCSCCSVLDKELKELKKIHMEILKECTTYRIENKELKEHLEFIKRGDDYE